MAKNSFKMSLPNCSETSERNSVGLKFFREGQKATHLNFQLGVGVTCKFETETRVEKQSSERGSIQSIRDIM